MDLHLPETALERLLAYVQLLERWNRRFSLTGVREPEEMVRKLLLDSLSLVHHLPAGEILLGCGKRCRSAWSADCHRLPGAAGCAAGPGGKSGPISAPGKGGTGDRGSGGGGGRGGAISPGRSCRNIITARAVKPPALLLADVLTSLSGRNLPAVSQGSQPRERAGGVAAGNCRRVLPAAAGAGGGC